MAFPVYSVILLTHINYRRDVLHMDERMREEIGQFRFSLIAPVVCRANLSYGEKYELLSKIEQGEYDIPYSNRKKVGLRTLERYLKLYKKVDLTH
jgi:hypothetical protein